MNIVSFYDDVQYGTERPVLKIMLDNERSREVRLSFRQGQEMKNIQLPTLLWCRCWRVLLILVLQVKGINSSVAAL